MSETLKGLVKWFNDAKGFGFIEHTSGQDVFVHYSVIEADGYKSLKDGEEVFYEIKEGAKGLHAANVRRVNPPATASKPEVPGAAISYEIPEIMGDSAQLADADSGEFMVNQVSDEDTSPSITAVE